MYIKELEKINLDIYGKSIPKFKQEYLSYSREENDGYMSCHPQKGTLSSEIILNKTTRHILKFCDGKNTTKEILDEMKKDFIDISEKILENDLIKVLYSLSLSKIIIWKGDNPFMVNKNIEIDNDMKINVANEADLQNLVGFFKDDYSKDEELIKFINPIKNFREYTDELIFREKLFTYKEEFFVLKDNTGNIKGVISVTLPVTNTITVAIIGIVAMPHKYVKDCLDFIKNEIRDIAVADISKIKVNVIDGQNRVFIKEINNSDFIKEGVLKNEIKENDLEVYSYIY